MPSASLLVSHGSRDPRPQAAMQQLARLISQRLAPLNVPNWQEARGDTFANRRQSLMIDCVAAPAKKPLVGTACLELSPIPLHEQIKEFADRALASGSDRIQVVPLFLLPGVHVMEDIPTEVAIAQQALEQELKINLRPHLGTHPGLSRLLSTEIAAGKDVAWIVLAHGSRRVGSQQPVEVMAKQLGAVSAYWTVPLGLESRVEELVGAGYRRIRILPYFLFAGGITDAIAQAVEQFQERFPNVLLQLAEPLGASAELAELIMDLMEE